MAKKIFDIIPPQKIQRKPRAVPEQEADFPLGKFLIVGLIIIGLAAVFFYFKFAEAEIVIRPETETVKREQVVTVDKNATTSNVSEGVIPGKRVSREDKISQQFSASEKIEERKAQGTLRVYNESGQPVTLVANTRFMSASQKVYRANNRMRVPVGGSTEVGVTAIEPGQEYNVKESKFSIPGLNGTALYTKMYAENATEISGGFKGKTYRVTENGLKRAESELIGRLKENGKSKLQSNYTVIPESFSYEVTDSFPSAQPGMKTENFTYQVAMKTEALTFKKQDLRQLVKEIIRNESENREIYDPSLSMNYEVDELKSEGNKALIKVKFSAKVYSPVNTEEIKTQLRGKSPAEARSELEREIKGKVKIKSRPYWIGSLPSNPDKINLKLIVE